MTRSTRTFSLTVNPPAGASTLAQAAAALPAGQWAVFNMGGLTNANFTVLSNTILDGCPIGQYDPINDRLTFISGEHGSGPASHQQMNCPASTNTWVIDPVEPGNIPDGFTTPEHGYYHTAVDWSNGDIYWIRAGGNQEVYKRTSGTGAWGQIPNTPIPRSSSGGTGFSMAQVWHPTMFGGRGGLVQVGVNKIAIYNPTTNSWALNPSTFTMGVINNVAVYNRADQCVYCGGGSDGSASGGANYKFMYRVDVNGTVTRRADFPIACGSNFNTAGGLAPLYASTGSNRIFLMSVAQQAIGQVIYEYNHLTDTWALIGNYPFSYGAAYAGFTVDSCGVVLFIYNTSANNMNTFAYIWKR